MANNSALPPGAFPPPPGVVPDFEAPQHEAIRNYFVLLPVLCYICMLIFCIIRAYVKASRFEMLADDCKLGKQLKLKSLANLSQQGFVL